MCKSHTNWDKKRGKTQIKTQVFISMRDLCFESDVLQFLYTG